MASPTSVATVEQMERTGAFFPAVHLDGTEMARLAAGAHDILGYDAIMPVFSVVQEAAALCCEIDWGAIDAMPVACTHPWADPDEVVISNDFLERPPIKAVVDAVRILRRTHGKRVAIVGKVMGPWTLSYHVHGIQEFLAATLLEPAGRGLEAPTLVELRLDWRSVRRPARYRPRTTVGSQVEIVGKSVTRPRLISSGTYQGIMAYDNRSSETPVTRMRV